MSDIIFLLARSSRQPACRDRAGKCLGVNSGPISHTDPGLSVLIGDGNLSNLAELHQVEMR